MAKANSTTQDNEPRLEQLLDQTHINVGADDVELRDVINHALNGAYGVLDILHEQLSGVADEQERDAAYCALNRIYAVQIAWKELERRRVGERDAEVDHA